MLQQALQKLNKEIAGTKQGEIKMIGALLFHFIKEQPQHAHLILDETKNLAGSFQACYAVAEKRKVSNKASMDSSEVQNIVLKYFGIPVLEETPPSPPAPVPLSMSLDDLL